MGKTRMTSVDDYIAAQPDASRRVLERVRRTIRAALPGADETISYGIPAYKLHGHTVLYFASWRHHYSLYPSSLQLVKTFKNELASYELRKGTIRIPLDDPAPAALVGRIAKFRASEVAASAREKAAARKKSIRKKTVRKRTRSS
jgi:uncharacterized protein YdhG (YjbR/CyaY superfamily)